MQNDENRLIDIEIALSNQEKMLEELNQVVIEQAKQIDFLKKQNLYLLNIVKEDTVKPQEQEVPPPHY